MLDSYEKLKNSRGLGGTRVSLACGDQPLNFGQIRSNFLGRRHGSDRNVPPAMVALVLTQTNLRIGQHGQQICFVPVRWQDEPCQAISTLDEASPADYPNPLAVIQI